MIEMMARELWKPSICTAISCSSLDHPLFGLAQVSAIRCVLRSGTANGGENHGGAGAGPWIMGDMENALWGANKGGVEQPINHSFVTAMLKGDSGKAPGHFAIKGADAQSGVFRVGGTIMTVVVRAIQVDHQP